MERRDLETLGRDDLVTRARRAGVGRAELLTRVELVDEIVKRTVVEPEKRKQARGLLGRARDLLATVIERGLHLPEAAQRVRSFSQPPLPPQPEAVATVTLAEIYAAQGHSARALDVLDHVLVAEPDHAAARALRERLADRAARTPTPGDVVRDEEPANAGDGAARPVATGDLAASFSPPQASAKPIPMLDDAPLPEGYGVDEAVVMPVDPTTAYVYWEVRPTTVARVRAQAVTGRLVVIVEAAADGRVVRREIEAERAAGDYFLFGLPPGAELRASLAWATPGREDPLAISSAFATPHSRAAAHLADTVVTWTTASVRPAAPTAPPAGVALAIAIARALDDGQTQPLAKAASAANAANAPNDPNVDPPLRAVGSSELLARGPRGPLGPLGSSEIFAS